MKKICYYSGETALRLIKTLLLIIFLVVWVAIVVIGSTGSMTAIFFGILLLIAFSIGI